MDYPAMLDAAESMLQEFGSVTVLRRNTAAKPDPVTGSTPSPTWTEVDVSAAVLPMDSATSRALDAIKASRGGARRLILTCRDLTPKAGDQVWIEGAWRNIPLLSPVMPDMVTAVVYTGAVSL